MRGAREYDAEMFATRIALLATVLSLCACGSAPGPDLAADDADYVFVFLKAGPVREVAPGDLQSLMQGHMANTRRLAAQGDLILAGPFAPPRGDPDDRGFAVFDTADVARAEELTRTDPAVQDDVFRFEAYPWRAPAALRSVNRLDRELRAELSPDAGPDATIRPYVLVTCADADAAERALAPVRSAGKVPFFGRFGGALDGHALFAVVARDPREARAVLESAGPDAPEWTFHPCFGARALLELAR